MRKRTRRRERQDAEGLSLPADRRRWGAILIRIPAGTHAQGDARLGVFCGKYMTDATESSRTAGLPVPSCLRQRDCTLNYFGVDASQPLSVWREKGWIHPDDPRGWFQWYCRYYLGRRMPAEDDRQIRRWKAMRRHIAQLQRNCDPGDLCAGRGSVRRCCSGHMTAAGSDASA